DLLSSAPAGRVRTHKMAREMRMQALHGMFQGLVVLATFPLLAGSAVAAGVAQHVVVLVWDGMRPDFVSEQTTPTLFKLSQEGVWFKNHHSVYIPSTEVNGTALATGAYPGVSGLIANHEFRPQIDRYRIVATESVEAIRKSDAATGNHYLACPTLAELLHERGLTTVIAGAKPVAVLHDRAERPTDSPNIMLYKGN